jgi:cytoskeletal protein RodZ
MNTIAEMDEGQILEIDNPGAQLATVRQQRGYTIEYIANRLHLRVRVLELIEAGQYELLPEPVFVKGYIRAYAKLLGVSPEPLLSTFNSEYCVEKKTDRALWQSKKESHKAEYFIRLFTIVFAIGVMVAVGIWWQSNKDVQNTYPDTATKEESSVSPVSQIEPPEVEVKLTDISKMHSLLNPSPPMSPMEKKGG